jgi:hypothetical protein
MTFTILIFALPLSFSTPQNHEIHDLEIYTQYLITIQVFNPEGMGPSTSVVCMTDEGGE